MSKADLRDRLCFWLMDMAAWRDRKVWTSWGEHSWRETLPFMWGYIPWKRYGWRPGRYV